MKIAFAFIILFSGIVFGQNKGEKKEKQPLEAIQSKVTVLFEFKYSNFPAKFKLYELPLSYSTRLWETRNSLLTESLEKVYSGIQEVTGKDDFKGPVEVPLGNSKFFLLVAENDTNSPVYFGAAPHSFEPADKALSLKFFCLCHGDSFRIKPKHRWSRIVQLRVARANLATSVKLAHNVFGLRRDQIILRDGDYTK